MHSPSSRQRGSKLQTHKPQPPNPQTANRCAKYPFAAALAFLSATGLSQGTAVRLELALCPGCSLAGNSHADRQLVDSQRTAESHLAESQLEESQLAESQLEESQPGESQLGASERGLSDGDSAPPPPTLLRGLAAGTGAICKGKLTLNPQPSTLNPQPSTLNPQPSTLNLQPSTLNL